MLLAVLLIIIGLCCILCAVFNVSWFMNLKRVQGIIEIFGERGARIFYVLLGLFFSGWGVYSLLFGFPGWAHGTVLP